MHAPKQHNWTGHLRIELGWAHYRGPIGDSRRHAHYATQLVFSQRVAILGPDGERLSSAASVRAIPSGVPHQIQSASAINDLIFLEPSVLAGVWTQLEETHGHITAESVVGQLERRPGARLPARFRSILECPDAALPPGFSARDASERLGISRAHFSHLFRRDMGLPFRQWVLWTRLNQSVRRVLSGEDHTQAALLAGFSDSAHLARTMRRMFGISLSALRPTR